MNKTILRFLLYFVFIFMIGVTYMLTRPQSLIELNSSHQKFDRIRARLDFSTQQLNGVQSLTDQVFENSPHSGSHEKVIDKKINLLISHLNGFPEIDSKKLLKIKSEIRNIGYLDNKRKAVLEFQINQLNLKFPNPEGEGGETQKMLDAVNLFVEQNESLAQKDRLLGYALNELSLVVNAVNGIEEIGAIKLELIDRLDKLEVYATKLNSEYERSINNSKKILETTFLSLHLGLRRLDSKNRQNYDAKVYSTVLKNNGSKTFQILILGSIFIFLLLIAYYVRNILGSYKESTTELQGETRRLTQYVKEFIESFYMALTSYHDRNVLTKNVENEITKLTAQMEGNQTKIKEVYIQYQKNKQIIKDQHQQVQDVNKSIVGYYAHSNNLNDLTQTMQGVSKQIEKIIRKIERKDKQAPKRTKAKKGTDSTSDVKDLLILSQKMTKAVNMTNEGILKGVKHFNHYKSSSLNNLQDLSQYVERSQNNFQFIEEIYLRNLKQIDQLNNVLDKLKQNATDPSKDVVNFNNSMKISHYLKDSIFVLNKLAFDFANINKGEIQKTKKDEVLRGEKVERLLNTQMDKYFDNLLSTQSDIETFESSQEEEEAVETKRNTLRDNLRFDVSNVLND